MTTTKDGSGQTQHDTRSATPAEAAEHARHLESLGLIASGLAHDFGNLLTTLQGTVELAWQAAIDHGRAPDAEALEEVRRQFEQATSLTRRLLMLAGRGPTTVQPISLAQLVRKAATAATSGSRTVCRYSLPHPNTTVMVDATELAHVIHNVVTNAREATGDCGVVEISASVERVAAGEADAPAGGNYVRLVVSDDGPGMPPCVATRIFDPYFTTKTKRRGLGLPVVKSIVERQSGLVKVHAVPDTGTRVEILIPVGHLATRTVHTKPPEPSGPRVLVMDDEPEVRWVLQKSLQRLGYQVDLAEHGERAVEIFEAALHDGDPHRLAILDLTIVDGMGGAETMRRLRDLDAGVRGIVCSGYSNDPVLASPTDYGFTARLEKPYSLDTLTETVTSLLAAPAGQADQDEGPRGWN